MYTSFRQCKDEVCAFVFVLPEKDALAASIPYARKVAFRFGADSVRLWQVAEYGGTVICQQSVSFG